MSTADPSPLMNALDAFAQRVWSDGERSFDDAFVEAIDDWLADTSAAYNDSRPFEPSADVDDLGRVLIALAASVERLRAISSLSVRSTADALAACLESIDID
ncbi:MAG: hypothetical protein KJO18_02930 [Acidimicrobiia bacterium]|jgi:hypothetical protein|nr:hypothetical protein [Acidimicrobiia bacterium]